MTMSCCDAVHCRLLQLLLDTQKSYNDLLHSYVASTQSHSNLLRFVMAVKLQLLFASAGLCLSLSIMCFLLPAWKIYDLL